MIRRAKILEIPEILRITKACAAQMSERGIRQWNDLYPDRASFEKDQERGELYVFLKHHIPIGSITITPLEDEEYKEVTWLTRGGRHFYIHRLAVQPEHQGQGYARKLMDFAETLARKEGATSVRLDTFSQNKRNQHFYEKRGYKRLGDVYFPKQSEHPFHCYELVLQTQVI